MRKTRSTVQPADARSPAAGKRPRPRATSAAKTSAAGQPTRTAKAKASRATRQPAKGSRSQSTTISATAQAVGRTLGRAASALAAKIRPGGDTGDAIALLEAEHRQLEELLDEGEKTTARSGARRRELLETITDALASHEVIEEGVMYPALKSHAEARDIVLEGYQEHHVANLVLKELHGLETSDERWGAKFKVFKENIEHHIEEEEGEMFKKARSVLSQEQLETLGTRMRRMKAHTQKTRG